MCMKWQIGQSIRSKIKAYVMAKNTQKQNNITLKEY